MLAQYIKINKLWLFVTFLGHVSHAIQLFLIYNNSKVLSIAFEDN